MKYLVMASVLMFAPLVLEVSTGIETASISQNKVDYKTQFSPDQSDAFSMAAKTASASALTSKTSTARMPRSPRW